MRDIWIRKSWLRLATGLIALAIIAAIWINYRIGLGRDAAPPPANPGKSGYLGIMSAGGVADAGKLDHIGIDAAPRPELSHRVATGVATDHQRLRIIRAAPHQVKRDRIGQSVRFELQPAGRLAVVVANAQHDPSA